MNPSCPALSSASSNASDATIRSLFFAGTIRNWQLILPDFGTVEGPFQIVALEFSADHAGEVTPGP